MKNDEEFIAGIYQKAKERKKEEEINAGHRSRFRTWQVLTAAACLCLIISGAVYAGSRKETPPKDSVSDQNAVMALSIENRGIPAADGENNVRVRTSEGEMRQEKNKILDGLWAGYGLACSIIEQTPSTKSGTKTQEAGGN